MEPEGQASSRWPGAMALLLTLITVSTLAGWALDIPVLRSIVPGAISMNPVTAVCFLFCAAAILRLRRGPDRVAAVAGIVVAAVGAVRLIAIGGFDFRIDHVLF